MVGVFSGNLSARGAIVAMGLNGQRAEMGTVTAKYYYQLAVFALKYKTSAITRYAYSKSKKESAGEPALFIG